MTSRENMQEILDVVDECDCVIGRAPRDEVHARHLKHRAVHVLVFNPQAELFIQKRTATKDTFPGRYDSSASGHLATGESYEASAVRELQEELGLTIPFDQIQPLVKIAADNSTGWEFTWIYVLRGDYRPQPNPSEIESSEFWPLAHVQALLKADPELFAPSFIRVFLEFTRRETVAKARAFPYTESVPVKSECP